MKKLKTKIFLIIFASLSLFTLTFFALISLRNNSFRLEIQNIYNENIIFEGDFIGRTPSPNVLNEKINKKFSKNPLEDFFILFLAELLIAVISHFLTEWVTGPVQESFEKQKQFLADASHELKTPIAVLLASSDAYEKDGNKKWLKNIRTETERMSELVKNLLDLSKLEQEKNLNFKEEDFSTLLESTILTTESLFFEKNIKLSYKIPENIKFKCNAPQIKQLINILIDNALAHAKKSSTVEINLKKEQKSLILSVKNEGKPIKKGEEEKIFERLYRSDESRNRNGHYGLGLAIAKTITENHSGEISAASKNGFTTFTVKLPLQTFLNL